MCHRQAMVCRMRDDVPLDADPDGAIRWFEETAFRRYGVGECLVILSTLLLLSALLLAIAGGPARASAFFPPDSGIINVRQFGAVGDGIADDTKAILRAIAEIPVYV